FTNASRFWCNGSLHSHNINTVMIFSLNIPNFDPETNDLMDDEYACSKFDSKDELMTNTPLIDDSLLEPQPAPSDSPSTPMT
ncbi:hypothetical protein KI387_032878, partial [Taxus chinensis]